VEALGSVDEKTRQQLIESGEVTNSAVAMADINAAAQEKWENMDPEEVEKYAQYLASTMNLEAEIAEDVALYTMKMN
jgi:hypothetical protein